MCTRSRDIGICRQAKRTYLATQIELHFSIFRCMFCYIILYLYLYYTILLFSPHFLLYV